MAISNVPGPAFPLYMAGAKMLTNYPTSIVVHGVALNITVQSYDESLDFGLIACGRAMPDVADLRRRSCGQAFEELQALPPPRRAGRRAGEAAGTTQPRPERSRQKSRLHARLSKPRASAPSARRSIPAHAACR